MKRSLFIIIISLYFISCQDPFSLLGIPALNPSTIFADDTIISKVNIYSKPYPINTPANPTETTRQTQTLLKKRGANVNPEKNIPIPNNKILESKNHIRAKVSAKNFILNQAGLEYTSMYNKAQLYPFGVEEIQVDKKSNYLSSWKLFKVLLVGKNTANHVFVRVCLPKEETKSDVCSIDPEDCFTKITNTVNTSNNITNVNTNANKIPDFNTNFLQAKENTNKISNYSNKGIKTKEELSNTNNKTNKLNTSSTRELPHDNITKNIFKDNANINNTNNNTATLKPFLEKFEKNVSNINNKITNLETRLNTNELKMNNQDTKINQMQINLDKDFNKLDLVLNKINNKLK